MKIAEGIYTLENILTPNFLLQKVSVRPKTGMALIFDHQLFHEGAAVLSGRK